MKINKEYFEDLKSDIKIIKEDLSDMESLRINYGIGIEELNSFKGKVIDHLLDKIDEFIKEVEDE